jgi:hypothetical protein
LYRKRTRTYAAQKLLYGKRMSKAKVCSLLILGQGIFALIGNWWLFASVVLYHYMKAKREIESEKR